MQEFCKVIEKGSLMVDDSRRNSRAAAEDAGGTIRHNVKPQEPSRVDPHAVRALPSIHGGNLGSWEVSRRSHA